MTSGPASITGRGEPTSKCVTSFNMSDLQSLVTKYNLSQADLDKQCDDDLFLTLMQQIPNFDNAAPFFHLTMAEINDIHSDQSRAQSRKRGMLEKWRNKYGSDATYLSIVHIFLHMKNRQLAEIVMQHVKELKQKEVNIFIKTGCVYNHATSKNVFFFY